MSQCLPDFNFEVTDEFFAAQRRTGLTWALTIARQRLNKLATLTPEQVEALFASHQEEHNQ